ncbi:MAG: hypothetical protein PHH08_05175, partial [Candidatus ainarchaeum sp.]|nr:hypothetical protein [Candidatus ainarchaeum sp.]
MAKVPAKINEKTVWLAEGLLRRNNFSARRIARRLGIHEVYLSLIRRDAGIPMAQKRQASRIRERLVRKEIENGMAPEKAAKKWKFSPTGAKKLAMAIKREKVSSGEIGNPAEDVPEETKRYIKEFEKKSPEELKETGRGLAIGKSIIMARIAQIRRERDDLVNTRQKEFSRLIEKLSE